MGKIKVQKAKHVQLKELLIEDIVKNGYPVGARLPSEQELIRRYDVSNTTIYKALTSLEHEGYIRREKGRGTFVADYKKSNGLKDKRIIGFVTIFPGMTDTDTSLFSDMLNGIMGSIQKHGCEMIFRSSGNVAEQEVQQINQLADSVNGLIIFPSAVANTSDAVLSALHKLQERQIPFVLVDRYLNGLNCNYVVTDNFAGTYSAVEHLAKLGHKSVLLLCPNDWKYITPLIDRVGGYDQAIKDFDVKETLGRRDESKIFLERNLNYSFNYKSIVEHIMKVGGHHAAVVTTEYYLAVGIIETAQRMGLKVPEDLAVVGFDEHQVPWHFSVGITTVIQPMYDIGQRAVDVLVDNMENGVKAPENIYLKPRLVVKDSCGAVLTMPA